MKIMQITPERLNLEFNEISREVWVEKKKFDIHPNRVRFRARDGHVVVCGLAFLSPKWVDSYAVSKGLLDYLSRSKREESKREGGPSTQEYIALVECEEKMNPRRRLVTKVHFYDTVGNFILRLRDARVQDERGNRPYYWLYGNGVPQYSQKQDKI